MDAEGWSTGWVSGVAALEAAVEEYLSTITI